MISATPVTPSKAKAVTQPVSFSHLPGLGVSQPRGSAIACKLQRGIQLLISSLNQGDARLPYIGDHLRKLGLTARGLQCHPLQFLMKMQGCEKPPRAEAEGTKPVLFAEETAQYSLRKENRTQALAALFRRQAAVALAETTASAFSDLRANILQKACASCARHHPRHCASSSGPCLPFSCGTSSFRFSSSPSFRAAATKIKDIL